MRSTNMLLHGWLICTLTIAGTICCSMPNNDSASQHDSLLASPSDIKQRNTEGLTMQDVVAECNKTFVIQGDYLTELNETGSFPDETDKTPMCFMRCYLQSFGILTEDDKVDKQTAVSMTWANSGEAIDDCLEEMTGSPCERAYFLTRCVMTRAIVDGKSKDANKK